MRFGGGFYLGLRHRPQSSPGRYSSDISHELSHLILRHSLSILMFAPDGKLTLRSYDGQQ